MELGEAEVRDPRDKGFHTQLGYEWAEPLAPRSLWPKGRRTGCLRTLMGLCSASGLKVMEP